MVECIEELSGLEMVARECGRREGMVCGMVCSAQRMQGGRSRIGLPSMRCRAVRLERCLSIALRGLRFEGWS